MHLFTDWVKRSLEGRADVRMVAAPSIFLNSLTQRWPFAKWLHYIDQYVLLATWLAILHRSYDVVVVCDHSNAPSSLLIPNWKLVVMVHDAIAILGAFGRLRNYKSAAISGRLLQQIIVASLCRASHLLVNPGPLLKELDSLGVNVPATVVGCPYDGRRFAAVVAQRPELVPPGTTFVFTVGSDLARKRKGELATLWSEYSKKFPGITLYLAGSVAPDTVKLINTLGPSSINLGPISDGELRWLYENCLAFVTMSEYEGFCIPVLDAAMHRKPSLVPIDVPFYREVFGGCVRSVISAPLRADELFDAINSPLEISFEESFQHLSTEYSFEKFSDRVFEVVKSYGKDIT